MLKSSLYDESNACIPVKGTISIAAQVGYNSDNVSKEVLYKNCAPFTDCISEVKNTQIDMVKALM